MYKKTEISNKIEDVNEEKNKRIITNPEEARAFLHECVDIRIDNAKKLPKKKVEDKS